MSPCVRGWVVWKGDGDGDGDNCVLLRSLQQYSKICDRIKVGIATYFTDIRLIRNVGLTI